MCTNIAELRGGVGFNIVPPRATLVVSLRPPPGASLTTLEGELAAIARAASPSVVVRTVLANPSLQSTNVAALRSLLGAACDEPVDLGFWTEAALLERQGINAVVFGPGAIAQAHAADEWVTIADLERAKATLAAVFAGEKG
jgi:acetylornithine deacetylase